MSKLPNLWVQVKGTASPTEVTCKKGNIDGLKKAAKAAMPSYLRTEVDRIIVSTDKEGHNRLCADYAISDVEDNSLQNPLWLGLRERE